MRLVRCGEMEGCLEPSKVAVECTLVPMGEEYLEAGGKQDINA